MVQHKASVQSVDIAVGVVDSALGAAAAATRRTGRALRPVADLVRRPPRPPRLPRVPRPGDLHPGRWVSALRQDGEARRAGLRAGLRTEVSRRLDALVPVLVDELLRRADPTELVLRYVDLDRAVSAVDLDAAAARLDVQAVLDRLDLVGLAAEVIDGVDLPEIIRESTGSMASDTVRGVRMQGIAADEAVGRAVDRLLLRRGQRSTEAPAPPAAPSVPVSSGSHPHA